MPKYPFIIKLISHSLPLLIAILCTVLVASTLKDYGISGDETPYLRRSESYTKWFNNPSFQTIDTYWEPLDGHPPLYKIIGALSISLFYSRFSITDIYTAMRIATLPFVFLISFVMTRYILQYYGIIIATMAGLLSIILPRIFFEVHLAALDFPVSALVFSAVIATTFANRSWRWYIFSVVLMGLALSTKLQGIYYYLSVIAYWIYFIIKTYTKHGVKSKEMTVAYIKVFGSIFIPPTIFYCLWPYLWQNSIVKLNEYISFIIHHVSIPLYYLGSIYTNTTFSSVPWHYVWIMTLITIPVLLLLAIIIGTATFWRKGKDKFVGIHAFLPLIIFSTPWAQKYDGVRLFISVFPFLIVMAACGVDYISKKISKSIIPKIIISGIICLTVFYATWSTHPYQMGYYNSLIGGVSGAKTLGFESEYWATSYKEIIPYIQQYPDRAYCVYPFTRIFEEYKNLGIIPAFTRFIRLSKDSTINSEVCSHLILLSRQGYFGDYQSDYWRYFKRINPIYSVMLGKVQLVGVYSVFE